VHGTQGILFKLAAEVSLRIARDATAARWSGEAAFLIGIASGPQAATSGFHADSAVTFSGSLRICHMIR
jgi:hypothetical protein